VKNKKRKKGTKGGAKKKPTHKCRHKGKAPHQKRHPPPHKRRPPPPSKPTKVKQGVKSLTTAHEQKNK